MYGNDEKEDILTNFGKHILMQVRCNHTVNQDNKPGMLLRKPKNGNKTHA